nr:ribonuclease T2 [Equus caballus]
MRPRAPRGVLPGALGLALCCLCGALGPWRSGDHGWKKLIMVHHWPTTVCKEIENACSDPPDYWTIHGLWPDKSEECNRSWHFNLEEIKVLTFHSTPTAESGARLTLVFAGVSSKSGCKASRSGMCSPGWNSWGAVASELTGPRSVGRDFFKKPSCRKHEWEKHGTCAAQLDVLNSQKKYFGKSLDLYKELSLNSMLQKLGIKPSINYYQISDIKDALASVYGVIPKVQCLPPRQGEEVQTIGQIELCLTKDLQLRNCTEHGEPRSRRWGDAWPARATAEGPGLEVCEDGPAFYPPPKETNH